MRRYVLALEAAADFAEILQHLRTEAGENVAGRLERVIRDGIVFLSEHPGIGHVREDLTGRPVKFFPIHSRLIVYRPETRPLQVIFHPAQQPRRRGDPAGPNQLSGQLLRQGAGLPTERQRRCRVGVCPRTRMHP
ncbi:MAG: type II toxin-antitoxin system RelE/ParE family toxin [Acidobacteriota bacterium]